MTQEERMKLFHTHSLVDIVTPPNADKSGYKNVYLDDKENKGAAPKSKAYSDEFLANTKQLREKIFNETDLMQKLITQIDEQLTVVKNKLTYSPIEDLLILQGKAQAFMVSKLFIEELRPPISDTAEKEANEPKPRKGYAASQTFHPKGDN